MNRESERLKRKIIEARKVIRKKFAAAKYGKEETERSYRTKHKPIINPIQSILSTLSASLPKIEKHENSNVADNIKKEEEEEEARDETETGQDDDDEENIQDTFHSLSDIYRQKLVADDDPNLDKGRYAIHYNPYHDRWSIGGKRVDIDGKDLIVKSTRFIGTRGLYDLLTCKKIARVNPPSTRDISNYRQIILLTNAHRKRFSSTGKIIPAKHEKFERFLEPYLKRFKRTGHGIHSDLTFKKLNRKPTRVEYVYWNKPTELVARLRLLLAAQQAGNTSVDNRNEILSIISELREDSIIK